MNRDAAVRAVAEALADGTPMVPADFATSAIRIVDALVAAGWGDLADARRKAMQEVTHNLLDGFREAGWGDVADGIESRTRHLWTAPEDTP
jgi:hypothetical protein